MEIHIILHTYVIFDVFNVKRKLNIIAVISDIYYNDILLTFHISRQ